MNILTHTHAPNPHTLDTPKHAHRRADGVAVSEPATAAVYTRRPPTTARDTFGPIYALPPAAWDDRLNVPAARAAPELLLLAHSSALALAQPAAGRRLVGDQFRRQRPQCARRLRPQVLVVRVQWLMRRQRPPPPHADGARACPRCVRRWGCSVLCRGLYMYLVIVYVYTCTRTSEWSGHVPFVTKLSARRKLLHISRFWIYPFYNSNTIHQSSGWYGFFWKHIVNFQYVRPEVLFINPSITIWFPLYFFVLFLSFVFY